MEIIGVVPPKRRTDNKGFIYICLILVLPVYWASMFYLRIVTGGDEEAFGTAVTITFFALFYVGWYITEIWLVNYEKIFKEILIGLTILIVASFIFLFAHADFQLHSQPAINLLLFWIPFFILSFSIGMHIRLFRMSARVKLETAQATAAQSQTELHLLQSQLSPHFLFNTLNNMYGLSITEHEKIPKLLLMLSDLLRYSVYEAKELFVPLKSEIDYVNNYIEFEKLRIGSKLDLHCEIENLNAESIKIAPMLLIVFIENAFKHAKNTVEKNISVYISLKTWNDMILFTVRNSYDSSIKKINNPNSGLGLSNARRRLQTLYSNEHDLKIEGKDNYYSVMLQLKAK